MKSVLTVKYERLQLERVKRKHRKFFRDGMKRSHVKEFCHKIQRKSLNIITAYFNYATELQELLHLIIITNDTSQIPSSLKELCAKGPLFVPTPFNYDLAQLQLAFDTFTRRMRGRYMFSGKTSPHKNDLTVIC